MAAYRAFLGGFYGFYGVAAVSAHPQFLFTLLKYLAVFHIGEEQFIPCFVGFFDFADFGEEEGNLGETFFFSGFSKFRIHGGPFIMFAFSSHLQMFSGGFLQVSNQPEPDFCMGSFIVCCFAEEVCNLAGAFRILFCFVGEEVIFYMSLGFTGIGSTQVLLGLCAFQSFHFF